MPNKFKASQVFSYATGNFGLNLFYISISTYLLYFYTDNMGISATAAGTLMFTAQLVNLIANPLMGIFVDRTKSRWGKFRPVLFIRMFSVSHYRFSVIYRSRF